MACYIDKHKQRVGVEPICTASGIARSTYYGARTCRPSARSLPAARYLGDVHWKTPWP